MLRSSMVHRPVTMREVARRAGVHPATVSRALRNDPRITPAQRALVRRVAAELGYRANPLIAALMSARRAGRPPTYQATFAFVSKYPAPQAAKFRRDYGDLLSGARQRALSQGFRLEEFNLHDPSLTARRATTILQSRGIQGLILAPLHSVRDTLELDWSQFSSVAVGYSVTQVGINRVAHNHFSGLLLAARHCRAAGRRRLGLVLQRRVDEKVERRWTAAMLLDQSLAPTGDAVPPLLLEAPDSATLQRWFRRHRPDAILGLDIPQLLEWLRHLGCAVPHDVAVVSLDRRPGDRGIAGIRQDYATIGAHAVDLLVGLIHRNEIGLPRTPSTLLTDGQWQPGRTLDAAR
ncbi:MAG: LacI family DNA-binding transcriptional regulator [Verrucomicrobia bacterium]|nr:LacI family DNA-binding transcriptional regulator [Verrucomicrobiota bacterium]